MELDLLRQVVAEPDDLAPRLVCADWYDERGDPRGEFIRLQLQLARPELGDDERAVLQRRQAELLRENVRRWNAPLHRLLSLGGLKNRVGARRKPIRGWTYARGFVEDLAIDARTYARHAKLLSRLGPIQRLRLFDVCDRTVVRDLVDGLPSCSIRSLVIRDHRLHPAHLAPLALSPHVAHLREVDLRGSGVGRVPAEAMFRGLDVRVLCDAEPQPYAFPAWTPPEPMPSEPIPTEPTPAPTRPRPIRDFDDEAIKILATPLVLLAFLGVCMLLAALDGTSKPPPRPAFTPSRFDFAESRERRRRIAELDALLKRLKDRSDFSSEEERRRAFREAFARISALPGARSTSLTDPPRADEADAGTLPVDVPPPPPPSQ